ncbi:MAG: hypothetical protein JNM61_08005 [Zoogloeaceae bacterium]|nr:hypothetical protein [Zoogloeaceae bacterium]
MKLKSGRPFGAAHTRRCGWSGGGFAASLGAKRFDSAYRMLQCNTLIYIKIFLLTGKPLWHHRRTFQSR